MNYYEKYRKYKLKYLSLKREDGNNFTSQVINNNKENRYAIVMFCILKDHYVLGACITAYLHKLFIKKTNKNIELVMMCDDYIYKKFKNTLKNYFDKVILIKLRYFNISEKYNYAKDKYSSWIGNVLNKWQCLKLIEYKKVLFLDIDIIPTNSKLYNLFDFPTPGIYIRHLSDHLCFNTRVIPNKNDKNLSFDNYIKNLNNYGTLDGGIILLEPNLDMYNDYVEFTDKLFKDGIYSHYLTAPEETSLFYYFMTNNIPIYDICVDYSVIPWDDHRYIKDAKAYNFLSFVKPWTKPKFMSWDEEMMWRYIYDIMPKKGKLEQIFKDTMVNSIDIFNSYNYRKKKKYSELGYYNLEYIEKYPEEVNEIMKSNNKYEKIMKLDKKIEVRNFGVLNTKDILSVLKEEKN